MAIIFSNLNQFSKKIYCKILAINFNDTLQSCVATYLRCGEVVNNQIKKGLLLSLPIKKFFNRRIFGKVTSKM